MDNIKFSPNAHIGQSMQYLYSKISYLVIGIG